MTNREKLQDQYEDALFALLMDDLAWREGASFDHPKGEVEIPGGQKKIRRPNC